MKLFQPQFYFLIFPALMVKLFYDVLWSAAVLQKELDVVDLHLRILKRFLHLQGILAFLVF